MASWGVYNSSLATLCTLISLNISRETGSVASAQFSTTSAMAVGDTVSFRAYVGPTTYITAMTGTVLSCKQNAQKIYVCQAVANNDDLRYYQAEYGGSRTINISNSGHTLRIRDYVAILIAGTGWTDGTLDNSVYVPNTTDYLPSMRFSNTFVSAALDKFLKGVCGYDIWYDNATKTVYYGEVRTDRTATTLQPLYSERVTSDVKYNISRIIVYGASNSVYGEAIKSGATTPYKTLMYRYADAKDAAECQSIAQQVLNDRQYTLDRYESTFTIEDLFSAMPMEGDKVHVHSPDVSLDADKGVKDVTFTLLNVVLGLGYPAVTIFDLLGDRLVEIGGSSDTGSEMVFSGGWQNLGTDVPTDWLIDIVDPTTLSEFKLKLAIAKWKSIKELAEGNAAVTVGVGHASSSAGTGNANVACGTGSANVSVGTGHANNSTGSGTANSSAAYLNTLSSYYSRSDSGGPVSLSSGSFVNVTDQQEIAAVSGGYHFGIAFLSLEIKDESGVGESGYTAKLYQSGVGYVSDAIPAFAYASANPGYYTVTFVAVFLGDTYSYGTAFYWRVNAAQGNCTVLGWGSDIMVIPRHAHTISDSGHSNHTVTDSGHSQTGSDSGHSNHSTNDAGHSNHSVTDAGHSDHPGSDSGHEHTPTDDVTEKGAYPTNVKVYLYNDTYPSGKLIASDAGGSEKVIDIGDITADLAAGENWISVETDTIGSGWLNGTFVSFGE